MPTTVMIAREATELEAEILRGRLEADGIETFLNGAMVASTVGPVNEFNATWRNPLGGVEIWVRAEDEAEARAAIAARRRQTRVKRTFPNALQIVVGFVVGAVAFQAGAGIHPVLGYAGAIAVLIGTFVLARK